MSLVSASRTSRAPAAALIALVALGVSAGLFGKGPRIGQFVPPTASGQYEKKGMPRHPVPHKGRRVEYAPNVVLVTYLGLGGGPLPNPGPSPLPTPNANWAGAASVGRADGGGGPQAAVQALGLIPEYKTYRNYYSRYHLSEAAIRRGETVESIITKVRRITGVRSAEPDRAIYKDQVPNDPGFNLMWGLQNTGQDNGTAGADIDAVRAWAMLPDFGPNVVVAVLDDGVDVDHPDLSGNILKDFRGNIIGYDTANDDNNPRPDFPDSEQHGTHVAGTVAAVTNNSIGVSGVGKRVKIMPIRMYSGQFGWMSDLADGLEFARLNGASVCNVSYNIDGYGQVLLDAVRRLDSFDIVYVNSSGNNGENSDALRGTMETLVDNVVFVAATDRNDEIASFSNFGQRTTIAAPGVDILSTVPNNGYEFFSGTSMATPHVAGAVGVMRAMFPYWNAHQIISKLEASSTPLVSLDGKIQGGRLNLRNAVEYDIKTPGTPAGATVIDRSSTTFGVVFSSTGDDGMTGGDVSYEVFASPTPLTNQNVLRSTAHTIATSSMGNGQRIANLGGLEPGKSYYVGVRARDNVGTYSQIRQLGPVTTASATWRDGFDTAGTWAPEGNSPWHVVEKAGYDGTRCWMDSHPGTYNDDTDIAFGLANPITLSSASIMRFRAKLAVEEGYDYLLVETSLDGGPWVTRAQYTGDREWAQYSITLPEVANKALKVRFRLVSDSSVTEDGVSIDDVSFVPLRTIFSDPATSTTNWNLQAPFVLSGERFTSSPSAINDSPGANYLDDTDATATYKSTVDTTGIADPQLVFSLWNDVEFGWDFLDVETAEGVNGANSPWKFRKAITGTQDWHTESVPLPSSPNATFRFHFISDFIFNFDGVAIDDVKVVGERKDRVSYTEATVDLDGYLGELAGRTVTVRLLDPATNAVKYTYAGLPLVPGAVGKAVVKFTVPAQGNYKVKIGGAPYVHSVVGTFALSTGTNSIGGSLKNGDVNNDNKIDATDLAKVRAALGTSTLSFNWNKLYDLTGDGRVDSSDEAIVLRNQGVIGA